MKDTKQQEQDIAKIKMAIIAISQMLSEHDRKLDLLHDVTIKASTEILRLNGELSPFGPN